MNQGAADVYGSSCGSAPDSPEALWSELDFAEAVARLVEMFELCACWFEAFPFDAQLPRIEPGRIVLPAAEPGVATWSVGLGVELPVRFDGLTLGRFVLVPATPTTGVAFSAASRVEAMAIAVSVGADLAAAVLSETAGGRARG